jgi:hypothetical protein
MHLGLDPMIIAVSEEFTVFGVEPGAYFVHFTGVEQ